MDEKLAQILTEELAKKGLSEEEINEILAKADKELAEEDGNDADNPEDTPNPDVVNEEEGAPTPEEKVDVAPEDVAPVTEEDAPTPSDDVPPEVDPAATDGSIEAALNELAAQDEGGDVPPVPAAPEGDLPPAPAPTVDPTIVEQLSADLGEAVKTIDALKARIESLEEALKESGVISKDSTLGDETPRVTPTSKLDGEDAFDDILAAINGR